MDDIHASVGKVMSSVVWKIENPAFPAEISSHAAAIKKDGEWYKAESERIKTAEAKLHRERGIQKPSNMPEDTPFMKEVRTEVSANVNSLQKGKRQVASSREKVRRDGMILLKELEEYHESLAKKFQERGC